MTLQLTRRLITVDEYNRMAEAGILTEHDRVELIHGEIIEMSPIGSRHSSTLTELVIYLKSILANVPLLVYKILYALVIYQNRSLILLC